MKNKCEKVSDFDRKAGQIMQINVNSSSISSLLTRVEHFISDSHKFYIVTPNPELVLASQTNIKLKKSLNSADISIPDGVGLKIANPKLKIIKGREFFMDLIKLAVEKNWKVFLLGGLDNEAELAAKHLISLYPSILISYLRGPKLNGDAKPKTDEDKRKEDEVISRINKFAPNLLFVAFGNPKQEIWINEHLPELNTGGAMAVGGTFRYIAGVSPLPPKWMANLGLEWLWRGFTEPRRIGRVFRAIVVFPLRYLIYSLPKFLKTRS